MPLLNRITNLLKADAHGVVDAVEDRGLLVRQHVREAEVALANERARLDLLVSEQKGLEHETAQVATEIDELDQDVDLALESGKDDLARYAIKRLLPLKRTRTSLTARLDRVRAERSELEAGLAQKETELEELKSRARAFLARAAQQADDPLASHAAAAVADEEVEIELMRRKQAGAAEEA